MHYAIDIIDSQRGTKMSIIAQNAARTIHSQIWEDGQFRITSPSLGFEAAFLASRRAGWIKALERALRMLDMHLQS